MPVSLGMEGEFYANSCGSKRQVANSDNMGRMRRMIEYCAFMFAFC